MHRLITITPCSITIVTFTVTLPTVDRRPNFAKEALLDERGGLL
jgi:hypothetical protein